MFVVNAARKQAQIDAEEAYRKKFAGSVLLRFTEEELRAIDTARKDKSRAVWIKAAAMSAVRRSK